MGWEDNFNKEKFISLETLLLKLKTDYNIEKIIGHYQVESTKECPSFDVPKWLEEHGLV